LVVFLFVATILPPEDEAMISVLSIFRTYIN
jgi:hypothetical protein